MARIFNFSAGPSILPVSVLEKIRDEFVDYKGSGMSLVEMSHRGKIYDALHTECIALIKELLKVPDNYKIMILGGGATLQFGMLPLNFLWGNKTADFTNTGVWAKKAIDDAKKVGKINIVWDGKADNYASLPDPKSLKASDGAAYFHMTSNETIGGVQWQQGWPDTGNVPIFCDMSSDFMSRPVPVEKFGIIYAGAQKNAGPAGGTIVIMREDLLERCPESIVNYLDYRLHAKENSLYNTPPVFSIWGIKLTMDWLKSIGGLPAAEKLATERSKIIYDAIERSNGYYRCPVASNCRSKMNVVFRLKTEELEAKFLEEAKKLKLDGLKGHRSVGGCRASVYNAMPIEGAKALANLMDEFAKKNG
ncbi:MAG TPA: 3-phosphoserine/phosphohydroxythreonine transaminase [Candidatus Ozemobacteraceae bacterium]|nr:3-phosphoserine/phosphohydroxythreonine transaminase [Candidatus Ozemobacteraceae bacterium]